ncbi:MAG: anti-sigma factor family protein [Planctomycetota bacterium]|jgi:hypothetical protein
MTNANDCQGRRETIVALVLGELDAQAADEIRQHIDNCESCRLLYQSLTQEEEAIQSAFKAVEDRSRAVGDNLVAQFDKGSLKSSFGTAILQRLRLVSSTPRRLAELAAAALIIIGVFVGIYHWAGSNVAWADVVEKFRSVPFFSASIYIKEDVISEPKQMELWMSRTGKTRLRVGTQVIFGHHGKIFEAFDIKTRSRVEADEYAVFFLDKIGEADEFSLDSIIRVMFGGRMQDVTPLVNPDAVISQDLVVFDVELSHTPEWVRIWALRESRLPVRIRVWDPRDGDATDAVFEYSKEQADEFFDSNAFEQLMSGRQATSRVNFAYAFLKDPGGKRITPEDMFEQSGYHMPIIRHAGITSKGAVWIIADKGQNRSPDGGSFYGFDKIEDDLGRDYRRVYATHMTLADRSMDVFVPLDYPFDERTAKKITLTCQNDLHPRDRHVVVGTVDLTEWKHDQLWPEGTVTTNEQQLAASLARRHCNARRFDKAERILSTIEGRPEDSSAALHRERIRLRMLLKQEKTDEALQLNERLMPLLEKRYTTWRGTAPDASIFSDSLLTLVYAGKLEEAKKFWHHLRNIKPELSSKLNKQALGHINESMQRSFESCLRIIVPDMSSKARLTVEQIDDILDVNVKKDETFKHYTFWDWNPEYEKPKYKNWERHLAELAEHYKSHPLPETMELLEHKKKEEYAARLTEMPGIKDYRVEPFNNPLKYYACSYGSRKAVGRVRLEGDIPDIQLSHDVVYRKDIPPQEMIRFVLNHFGLEVMEVNEPRTVWIARHDGSELKDPEQVRAPVPRDASGKIKTGMMSSSARPGFGFEYLFRNFMYWQNKDYNADCIVIVDETGITDPVSCEGPRWDGPEAPDMARKWFKDEMGIIFTEETRTMKTHVVRKR